MEKPSPWRRRTECASVRLKPVCVWSTNIKASRTKSKGKRFYSTLTCTVSDFSKNNHNVWWRPRTNSSVNCVCIVTSNVEKCLWNKLVPVRTNVPSPSPASLTFLSLEVNKTNKKNTLKKWPVEGSTTRSHSDGGFLCRNFFLDPSETSFGTCRSLRCCWRWSWAGRPWTCPGVSCTGGCNPENTHEHRNILFQKIIINPVTEENRWSYVLPQVHVVISGVGLQGAAVRRNHTESLMWKMRTNRVVIHLARRDYTKQGY